MVTVGIDGEASSGEEFAPDFYISWLQQVNQVIHDDIYAVFMEVTVIAEAEEVEFQGFAFYHEISGNVGDVDGGKIGLPCLRAQAGEFGAVEFDEIVTVLVLVGNSFQIVGVIIVFVAGVLIAQEGQLIQSFSFFHGLSPLQHIFKQLAVFRGIEFSGGGNGGGYGPRLFNAPGGHAGMFSIDTDDDIGRSGDFFYNVSNIGSDAFLNLKTTGYGIGNACTLERPMTRPWGIYPTETCI